VSLKVLIGVLLLGKVHDYQHTEQESHMSSNPATGQQLKSSDSILSHISQSSVTEVNCTQELKPSSSGDSLLENITASYSTDENVIPKEELFLKQKWHQTKKPLSEIERYTLCSNRIV